MVKKAILSIIILVITVVIIAAVTVYVVLEQEKQNIALYEPTDITNVVITLHRSACFGSCPVYNLTIYGNGTVIYEGRAYVNVTGVQRSTISEATVRQLLSAFRTIEYFSLNETEIASHVIYDVPVFTSSLSVNGKTKTILHYEGTEPDKLTDLENTIDILAGSGPWVGHE